MANTPLEPPIRDRDDKKLLEDLCIGLRNVGVWDSELPGGDTVRNFIEETKMIHAELKRRGVDVDTRVSQLSDESGWLMGELLEDCLGFPKTLPYVKEGTRREGAAHRHSVSPNGDVVNIECLKGKTCTRIYEHYPENFTFEFDEASLAVDCLWRIKIDGRVALTSRDHRQQFGLPAPVDAHAEALSRLKDRRVIETQLDERSADVMLEYEGGLRLEVLNDSSGYEPWNLRAPRVHLVGLGGGGIANFSEQA